MKKAAAAALSLLIWCVGWIWFSLGGLCLLLISVFRTGGFFETWLKGLCRSLVWICGIRVRVSGRENFQAGRQYLLMMNHVNILDAFVFYRSFPGKARGIEEESHFDWPVYGWVIRRMGQIPVNRKSGIKAMESLRRAAELIRQKKDYSFMVLPEGTRSRDGKLGPFKKGGFLLALETGLEILPLVQKGAYLINRRHSLLIRPGRIKFVIEKPISTQGFSRENIAELMEKVRAVFLKYVE
ncbi:MAG: 1-acyl-sn-glycerol-3-phosphate acyltransferase [Acidobacteria bacterium]|nr:1-acyl-sn-glycerol-3-phosphate acyltransferase [Acidobacteriota bacterium]MBU4307035.1 1-acyl-sn-glycerol-3-phosphate acyltransferase [Acidobacteriota bacterium]MBU4405775.1 1-acyl-sn-glycerol-3-phosphate acyltransferase [Acidobacteriota bacterium]MCG2810240.1 1-acyl-sn-glycerol-3-phosphate acyltransferase [Candidatus Aminicenantes bacterium]